MSDCIYKLAEGIKSKPKTFAMKSSAKTYFVKTEAGSVLSLVVLMSVAVSIIGISLMSLGLHARMRALRTGEEISARVAADAGLVHAVCLLNRKISEEVEWDDNNLPSEPTIYLPNCKANYGFLITGDTENGYVVESTGLTGIAQKTVTSKLKLRGLFEYAIFGNELIELKMGTSVYGYNFEPDDSPLRIGTNSVETRALDLKNGVTIEGDVVIGPGGDADNVIASRMDVDITGDIYPLPVKHALPLINVPEKLRLADSVGNLIKGTTISSDCKYDEINLRGKGQIVEIDGNVTIYVVGDVILGNSAEFCVANTSPDTSLTLYLGGNLMVRNGALINNLTENPKKLQIYGLENCNSIDFLTNSLYYGAIYAPFADVVMHNNVEIFGSVVAKSFVQHVKADFHYDASLRDVNLNDIGVSFVVGGWREQ